MRAAREAVLASQRETMGRVKGTMLVPLVKMLRANKVAAAKLLPVPLQKYLEERVLPSSWYPSKDHVQLARVLVAIVPLGKEPYHVMGRGAALHDLTGIYKARLHAGDPMRTLESTIGLWRTYCDSGEMQLTRKGERSADVTLSGYVDVSREMCGIAGGYVAELATLGGAKNVVIRKLSCRLDGAPQCKWELTWS
ncbi:MAG TPA: hypothetical protein VIA18_14885 [Polyangia bacterium]|jgi:hypothetical protein|nr:hypothetical protein [Polyangia bacterium]